MPVWWSMWDQGGWDIMRSKHCWRSQYEYSGSAVCCSIAPPIHDLLNAEPIKSLLPQYGQRGRDLSQ